MGAGEVPENAEGRDVAGGVGGGDDVREVDGAEGGNIPNGGLADDGEAARVDELGDEGEGKGLTGEGRLVIAADEAESRRGARDDGGNGGWVDGKRTATDRGLRWVAGVGDLEGKVGVGGVRGDAIDDPKAAAVAEGEAGGEVAGGDGERVEAIAAGGGEGLGVGRAGGGGGEGARGGEGDGNRGRVHVDGDGVDGGEAKGVGGRDGDDVAARGEGAGDDLCAGAEDAGEAGAPEDAGIGDDVILKVEDFGDEREVLAGGDVGGGVVDVDFGGFEGDAEGGAFGGDGADAIGGGDADFGLGAAGEGAEVVVEKGGGEFGGEDGPIEGIGGGIGVVLDEIAERFRAGGGGGPLDGGGTGEGGAGGGGGDAGEDGIGGVDGDGLFDDAVGEDLKTIGVGREPDYAFKGSLFDGAGRIGEGDELGGERLGGENGARGIDGAEDDGSGCIGGGFGGGEGELGLFVDIEGVVEEAGEVDDALRGGAALRGEGLLNGVNGVEGVE